MLLTVRDALLTATTRDNDDNDNTIIRNLLKRQPQVTVQEIQHLITAPTTQPQHILTLIRLIPPHHVFTTPLIPILVTVVKQHPNTILALAARDLIYAVIRSKLLASSSDDDNNDTTTIQYLWDNLPHLSLLLKYESTWISSSNPALCAALTDLQLVTDTLSQEDSPVNRSLIHAHWRTNIQSLSLRSSSLSTVAAALYAGLGQLVHDKVDAMLVRMALRDVMFQVLRAPSESHKDPALIRVLIDVLKESHLAEVHKLATSFLCACAMTSTTGPQTMTDSLFLDMLDETDAVAYAAVELVSQSAFRDPTTLFVQITSRLDDLKHPTRRKMAIAVIRRIVEMRTTLPSTTTSAADKLLAQLLLDRLSDPNVDLRNETAAAFHVLDAELCVSPLMTNLTSKSDQVRSASAEAFLACMRNEASLRYFITTSVNNTITSRGDVALERALDLLPRLSETELPVTLIPMLLHEMCVLHPESHALVGLVRRLAPLLFTRYVDQVLEFVLNLQSSPPPDIVHRLSPYLVLMMIPRVAWNPHSTSFPVVVSMLCDTFMRETEFPAIRKTSVEILARLPGFRPWAVFLGLITLDDAKEARRFLDMAEITVTAPSRDLARLAIYGMCFAVFSSCVESIGQNDDKVPPMACSLAIRQCRHLYGSNTNDEDTSIAVCEGISEFLAMVTLWNGFPNWVEMGRASTSTSRTAVQEVTLPSSDELGTNHVGLLFHTLFSQHRGERLVASQALSLVARALAGDGRMTTNFVSQLNLGSDDESKQLALRGFWNAFFHHCYMNDFGTDDSVLFPVLFITLFFVQKMQKNDKLPLDPIHLRVFYSRVLATLIRGDVLIDVLLPSLQLLGLLLAMPDLTVLRDGDLGRTRTALTSISNLAPDPTARALAEELLRLAFVG